MNTYSINQTPELKEQTQHGDIFFPVSYYRTVLDPQYHPLIDIHWHPEMEFTKVEKGSALYSVNFSEFLVSEGDFLCIQSHFLHSARLPNAEQFVSDNFVFHLDILGHSSADICNLKYLSPIQKSEIQLPFLIRKDDAIYPQFFDIFEKLSTCYHKKSFGYELLIKSCLLQLTELLLTHQDTLHSQKLQEQDLRLKTVFQYIKEHFQENISIEQAASLCCITPSHFMHYFREKTGCTFNQYLNQYRLGQAAILLKKEYSIAEAAYSCGFNNLPYFYRRFQEFYKMTPREFQKNLILKGTKKS